MKTRIVFILDRSGSMANVRKDTIGGFNSFLKQQKKIDGDVKFTLAQFDNKYELIYDNVDIKRVKKLDNDTFVPRGATALLDAIGRTINGMSRRKKDETILIAILTDGYENDSREYNNDQINKLIKKCRKKDWAITFLAANEDAFKTAQQYGISINNTMSFANTGKGHRDTYLDVGNAFFTMACCGGDTDNLFNTGK